jgi:hypothetical protein
MLRLPAAYLDTFTFEPRVKLVPVRWKALDGYSGGNARFASVVTCDPDKGPSHSILPKGRIGRDPPAILPMNALAPLQLLRLERAGLLNAGRLHITTLRSVSGWVIAATSRLPTKAKTDAFSTSIHSEEDQQRRGSWPQADQR